MLFLTRCREDTGIGKCPPGRWVSLCSSGGRAVGPHAQVRKPGP